MLCQKNMVALGQKMMFFKVKFGENGLTKTALTAKCGMFFEMVFCFEQKKGYFNNTFEEQRGAHVCGLV